MKKIIIISLVLTSYMVSGQVIVATETNHLIKMAAKEVRRYTYLRTGQLLDVKSDINIDNQRIIVGTHDAEAIRELTELRAPEGGFFIKSINSKYGETLLISGDTKISTLYAAYRYAELIGCRFYLHGDVIPDQKIGLKLTGFDEQGQPTTKDGRQWKTRGIQPFQNFPAGSVMWGVEDWKMHIAQLPKMGMNFVGLHTYMSDPEDDHVGDYGPNLNVWIGHENDLNVDGTVDFAYDATFFHTHQQIIGWGKTNTSDLKGGANHLFPSNGYPSEIIGESYHTDQNGYTHSFNKAGTLFKNVFTYANLLGVTTATGVELPLGRDKESGSDELVNGVPEVLQNRLINEYGLDPLSDEASKALYRGMYRWLIYNQIPVDYFWIWTTEIWMPWGGGGRDSERIQSAKNNLKIAVEAWKEMEEKPFDRFALGGWAFGAQGNPDVFGDILPSIEDAYSFMNPPYNMKGRHMKTEEWIDRVPKDRVKWPFTWMEYDYSLEQPSFHMYRILEDGQIAWEQHADGFMGEFWRTRMISPQFAAVKDVSWDYSQTDKVIISDLPMSHQNRNKKIDEIYLDWAIHEFGNNDAAQRIASDMTAFEKPDDKRFMNVTNFTEGADDIYSQGYITGDDWGSDHIWGAWENEAPKLNWINEWEELRGTIVGQGNFARFDYWMNTMKSYRLMANISSEINQYKAKIEKGALDSAAAHRSNLARLWEKLMSLLVQRVHDEVDLGVILNLQWRSWNNWIVGKYDREFLKAGGRLPADHAPSMAYQGEAFITCMPIRTHILNKENYQIKALIMGQVSEVTIHYRKLGSSEFESLPMPHVNRGVYQIQLPDQEEDFEWYVAAKTDLGDVVYPATARANTSSQYQTVIVLNQRL